MTETASLQNVKDRALYLIGAKATVAGSTTTEGTITDAFAEDVLHQTLASHPWRFATKQVELVVDGTAPLVEWETRWDLPIDFVTLTRLYINGVQTMNYDQMDLHVYCDARSTDSVVIEYVWDLGQAVSFTYPKYFLTAVTYALAAAIVVPLTRDSSMLNLMQRQAEYYLRIARNRDSQQQPSPTLDLNRFTNARRGYANG